VICAACGSTAVRPKWRKGRYRIVACTECRLAFVTPPPTTMELAAHYNQMRVAGNFQRTITEALRRLEHDRNWPKRDWYDSVLALGRRHCGKDRLDILEVGAAYGIFVHYANSSGHHAVGTEVTPEFAEASRGLIRGEVVHVPDERYEEHFPPGSFDVVLMEHVLEHMREPRKTLASLRALLRQDGILVICVPNHESLAARMLGPHWAWVCPPDHVFFYNCTALTRLLKGEGWQIRQEWTADYFFRSIYQFYSLDRLVAAPVRAMNKIFRTRLRPREHSYRYPRRFADIMTLLPYWALRPLLRTAARRGRGSELVVVASKSSNGTAFRPS